MRLKQKIYRACLQLINDKIQNFQSALNDLSEGAKNDSKSSAGDKHETARAMMQLEQEKISKQLDETLVQKAILQKIDVDVKSAHIQNGSLIKTNHGYLFLSIALGKIKVDKMDAVVLSAASPLGVKLLGKEINSSVEINTTKYSIEEIY
jgi:predicted aspartyl protease